MESLIALGSIGAVVTLLLLSSTARAKTPASTGVMDVNGDLRPRGIRNNNPGNIEDRGEAWKGLTGNDGRYIIFEHVEFGIRAINRILNTYASKHGLNTIRGVVDRWAPDFENDTASYIISVSRRVGIGPDAQLTAAHRVELIKAIIYHENGQQPYTDDTIKRGIELP